MILSGPLKHILKPSQRIVFAKQSIWSSRPITDVVQPTPLEAIVWDPASTRLQCIENQRFPVIQYKHRQTQHMCSMFTVSKSADKPIYGYAVFMQTSLFRYCLLVVMC